MEDGEAAKEEEEVAEEGTTREEEEEGTLVGETLEPQELRRES